MQVMTFVVTLLVVAWICTVSTGCASAGQHSYRGLEQPETSSAPLLLTPSYNHAPSHKQDYIARQTQMLKENLQGSGVLIDAGEEQTLLEVPVQSLFFDDSADLKPSFYYALDSLAKTLAVFRDTQLMVWVPSNTKLNGVNNEQLSMDRARNIKQFLIGRRVSINRIQLKENSNQTSATADTMQTNPANSHHLQMLLKYP